MTTQRMTAKGLSLVSILSFDGSIFTSFNLDF